MSRTKNLCNRTLNSKQNSKSFRPITRDMPVVMLDNTLLADSSTLAFYCITTYQYSNKEVALQNPHKGSFTPIPVYMSTAQNGPRADSCVYVHSPERTQDRFLNLHILIMTVITETLYVLCEHFSTGLVAKILTLKKCKQRTNDITADSDPGVVFHVNTTTNASVFRPNSHIPNPYPLLKPRSHSKLLPPKDPGIAFQTPITVLSSRSLISNPYPRTKTQESYSIFLPYSDQGVTFQDRASVLRPRSHIPNPCIRTQTQESYYKIRRIHVFSCFNWMYAVQFG
ncbi:hypothetical protein CHS0354_035941 [Potamilus streckersoni]|uniref:Uncharacterized protein n=1 Tax=Potamilus streckersoni TaxID=2493646 RepID=A0AAE0TG80_9BIVA|nr:hypothetical protein CHS0354_035941 [Potamilus streckersoni]